MTALAIAAVCITAALMVRASLDDALQFHEDLNDLYEFLHGKPLEPR